MLFRPQFSECVCPICEKVLQVGLYTTYSTVFVEETSVKVPVHDDCYEKLRKLGWDKLKNLSIFHRLGE